MVPDEFEAVSRPYLIRRPDIPKLEELDWRARKKPVVPDEFKAVSRPYLIRRPDSKHGRCESSRSYQKGVGKLENRKTKVEYEPNASHRRRKRSRKCPTCKREYPESTASAAANTGNKERQQFPRRTQGAIRPAKPSNEFETGKPSKERRIVYERKVNHEKDTRRLQKVDKPKSDSKKVKNIPNDQKNPEKPSKSPLSEAIREGLIKGEQTRTQGTESTRSRDSKMTDTKSKSTNGVLKVSSRRLVCSLYFPLFVSNI